MTRRTVGHAGLLLLVVATALAAAAGCSVPKAGDYTARGLLEVEPVWSPPGAGLPGAGPTVIPPEYFPLYMNSTVSAVKNTRVLQAVLDTLRGEQKLYTGPDAAARLAQDLRVEYRLINIEPFTVHRCLEVASGKTIRVQRVVLPEGREMAIATEVRTPPIPPGATEFTETQYETTRQQHLDAIKAGRRKLLDAEATKDYWYEMTLDDGSKTIMSIGGDQPLPDKPPAETKPVPPAAASASKISYTPAEIQRILKAKDAAFDNAERDYTVTGTMVLQPIVHWRNPQTAQ